VPHIHAEATESDVLSCLTKLEVKHAGARQPKDAVLRASTRELSHGVGDAVAGAVAQVAVVMFGEHVDGHRD